MAKRPTTKTDAAAAEGDANATKKTIRKVRTTRPVAAPPEEIVPAAPPVAVTADGAPRMGVTPAPETAPATGSVGTMAVTTRIIVCAVLLLVGGLIFWLLVLTKPVPGRAEDTGQTRRVVVMPAMPVDVRRQWEGFGTARAMDTVNVPARVTAVVHEVPPDILAGAWVDQGALLVRLDDSDFARQVEITTQALADIDTQLDRIDIQLVSWKERAKLADEQAALARAEYDRWLKALSRDAAKDREVDQAKQALLSAIRDQTAVREELDKLPSLRTGLQARRLGLEAERRIAQQNLERCRIESPLAGVIQLVDVEVGENLLAGERVARVVALGRLEVPLRLPSSARQSVRVGDEVMLRATGVGARGWRAEITRIAPEEDGSTRTMTAYVEVEQDPRGTGGLAPGQFVRGTVWASARSQRWVVPRRSVEGDRILTVADGQIASRPIEADYQLETMFSELGVPDAHWVVLRSPLENGVLVVLNPTRSLADGVRVTPVTTDDRMVGPDAGDGTTDAAPGAAGDAEGETGGGESAP